MANNIYVGNGKKQNEGWRKSSFCLSDIPKEHIFEYNGKKYVKVNINDKDQPDQYGKDVTITVDTWKPEQKQDTTPDETDNLPF